MPSAWSGCCPRGPEGAGRAEQEGCDRLRLGLFWSKGQRIGTGQTSVKKYNRFLCDLIATGRAKPSFIVSHELPLAEAPEAYEHFDAREDGWTKVVLKPAA